MGGNSEGHVDSHSTCIRFFYIDKYWVQWSNLGISEFICYKSHWVNWPLLRQKQMYKTIGTREKMDGKIFVIDHYAKDGGAEVVGPSCSFYHDPLQHELFIW